MRRCSSRSRESAYLLLRSTRRPYPRRVGRQLFFALEGRQAGDVVAVEFEKVEGEIGVPFTAVLD